MVIIFCDSWYFAKFSFYHKWNNAWLLVINMVYKSYLTSCWSTWDLGSWIWFIYAQKRTLVCFLVNNEKENIKQEDLHTLCFIFLAMSLTVHDSAFSMIDILRYVDCNSPRYTSNIFTYKLIYICFINLIAFNKH